MHSTKSCFKIAPSRVPFRIKLILLTVIMMILTANAVLLFVKCANDSEFKHSNSTKSVRIMLGASFDGARIVLTQHNYIHASFVVRANATFEDYPTFRVNVDVTEPLEIFDRRSRRSDQGKWPDFAVPPDVYLKYRILMIERTKHGLEFFEGDYVRY